MNILILGGGGYIGSHMVKLLLSLGHTAVVFDNFSTGHRRALTGGTLIEGDLLDRMAVLAALQSQRFDGVIHFASSIVVGESVVDPLKFYRNNVAGTINLLDACISTGTRHLVFSSSAAVYGDPVTDAIDEQHKLQPISPYGRTKLICEQMLQDCTIAHGLHYAAMRYFNACGADPGGELGERHDPETHLIPLVLQTANQRRTKFVINGNNFATHDGTCIRDYVHVMDLCEAHILALEYLKDGGESTAFNLGAGNGHSVKDVIEASRIVTGKEFSVCIGPRREGDPPRLVATCAKAKSILGWQPQYSDLRTMVQHAWNWEQKLTAEANELG
jgi:UDP-glucose 4-epimerase